jgi:hypothetical protein
MELKASCRHAKHDAKNRSRRGMGLTFWTRAVSLQARCMIEAFWQFGLVFIDAILLRVMLYS